MRHGLIAFAALALAACTTKPSEPEFHGAVPVADAGSGVKATLTFLVTGAENGYLLSTPDQGKQRGGAAEVLARWVADGHCPGALGSNGESACAGGATIVLSTGDNANGQAISSFFRGESTAEVMKHMGYAASAFGNRELDWAREQFAKNTATGGFPYLAANLKAKDDEGKKLGLAPYRIVERKGVKVGVVGLAARKATWTPMPGRMSGLELVKDDAALAEAIPAARQAGADVIAVVSDGCLNELPELLSAHPEWAISFVAGRDCEREYPESVGMTRLVYPGRHFNDYAKVTLTVDLGKTPAERTSATPVLVDVVSGDGAPPPEPKAQELIDGWKKKLDAALGERIGFSKAGVEQESWQMSAWLTTALKEQFKTDVALVNRKAVRQSLPPGPLTKATIWDLVPFENEIIVVKVPGEALITAMQNVEARAAGVRAKGEGFVDAKGAAIDPKKTYSVATLDYLYLGGESFTLNQADKAPVQTKTSVQAALIEWTKAKKSDEKKPLEVQLKK